MTRAVRILGTERPDAHITARRGNFLSRHRSNYPAGPFYFLRVKALAQATSVNTVLAPADGSAVKKRTCATRHQMDRVPTERSRPGGCARKLWRHNGQHQVIISLCSIGDSRSTGLSHELNRLLPVNFGVYF